MDMDYGGEDSSGYDGAGVGVGDDGGPDFDLELYDEEGHQQQLSVMSDNKIRNYTNGSARHYHNNSSYGNGDPHGGEDAGEYDDYSEEDYYNDNGEYQEDQEDQFYQEEEDEEYPDTLQFCEAQFDDGGMEDDDEEARGLPPVAKGNYGEGEFSEGTSQTRITTNAAGIRIVESSTVLEPEEEEEEIEDYEQYQYELHHAKRILQPPQPKKVQMNKPRKFKQEKAAAEALIRQLQAGDDYSKPNILARKLMGVPSQTVQATRPPPLKQKPHQKNSNSLLGSQLSSPSVPISLESILRQKQRSSVPNMPRLQPRTASGMVMGSQLKIKSSHGIPTQKSSYVNNLQQRHQQKAQQLQMASQVSSKFLFHSSQHSNPSTTTKKARSTTQQNYQYQIQQANTAQAKNSARNGNGTATTSLVVDNNNRISIASIQQQLQAQQQSVIQSKPLKNVPRCHVCKRTFATNQVLQRHMALHGPIATISETESGEYKCEECFTEFDSPFSLAKHMQSHINNTDSAASSTSSVHRCRVCYRTFTCLESLKSHSLMHDGEFKCRACRRGFPDWNSLEEHEATHKRYNCQWCEKYFMNSGNLKAHERIHTGERPYKCQDCPKAFKQLGGLQYHLKTNPTHKPQKYHKHLEEGAEAENGDEANYQYGNYDSEDYDDNGIGMDGDFSLAAIAASAGL